MAFANLADQHDGFRSCKLQPLSVTIFLIVVENFPYRMADLVNRSGASREAVRYYIREGLLPSPQRTAKNMAWYSDRHLELIKLIRVLQEEQFLPLKAIKSLLNKDQEYKFTSRQREIFAGVLTEMDTHSRRGLPRPLGRKLASTLGLSKEDYDQLVAMGLICSGSEPLTREEEELLRQFAVLRQSGMTPQRGFTPQHLEIVQAAADLLFDQELRMFQMLLGNLRDDEIPGLMERVVPAINRIFGFLHERKLRAFIARFGAEKNGGAAKESLANSKQSHAVRRRSKSTVA
ncbi:MAG: MerR family transcriptional regulator [Paraburkholderia fungorum]|nr:MerR family transcriptional regulator [Paraburkholderia fungorum]